MSELTKNDYKKILEYYSEPMPKSDRIIKDKAEKLLASKLCRCIKKVDKTNEGRAIGICTKTIFNKKGYTRGKFKCKGNQTIKFKKTLKNRK
jgi:hypothetical protein